MKAEEKQALTGLCNIEIKRWKAASESNPNMRYMVELMEVALAALTAPPVKLPPRRSMLTREDIDQDYVTCMAISVEDAISAIRAAGYEVQE